MNPGFWSGKRVLVTGHTGFKGSWLSLWLRQLGASVVGYSLPPPTDPSLFDVARVGDLDAMVSAIGDVVDYDRLASFMVEQQPEIVIHLAAQSLVRHSYEHPRETYLTNVMGTVNVLEAIRHTRTVRVVVVVTSDKCYHNREWARAYREGDRMGGDDPYSSSKGCAELIAAAYRTSYWGREEAPRPRVAVATARAGNVIGGGDWAKDRLMPDVLNAFMTNRPARLRHPTAIRPWQHVLDPLHGYLTLAERLWKEGSAFAESLNFGPNEHDARPVSWIVDQLATLWGTSARWEADTSSHPHEAQALRLDCSHAKARLGWVPLLSLAEALEWVIEWYQVYQKEGDLRHITQTQILRYQKRIGV